MNNTEDKIKILNLINYKIAELVQDKERLEAEIFAESGHGEEGQKTYKIGNYKCTITTGYNYTLNKEEYEIMRSRVPAQFNPVKTRVAYDIDAKIIRDAEKYASSEEMLLISSFLSKKPKKLHVKITAGV